MNQVDQIKKSLSESNFMVLATSEDNHPWISPLFFATEDNKTFYWHSGKDTKHSQIIAKNPSIAVVIFNSTNPEVPGLYMKGKGMEVVGEELQKGLEVLFTKAQPDEEKRKAILACPEDFEGEGKLRLYKFVAESFSTNIFEVWNDKFVDSTEELTL